MRFAIPRWFLILVACLGAAVGAPAQLQLGPTRVPLVPSEMDRLNRAIERDPARPAFRLERARQRAAGGQVGRAVEDLDVCLRLEPDNGPARSLRATLRLREGDVPGARADAEAALRGNARDADALATLATVQARAGENSAAEATFDRLLALPSPRASAHAGRAQLRVSRGDLPGARADLDAAIEREPGGAEHRYRRAWVCWWMDDLDGALGDINQAIILRPTTPEAHRFRGVVLLRRGEWAAAVPDLHRHAQEQPRDEDAMRTLIWLAQARSADPAAADAELSRYASRRTPPDRADWPGRIIAFLLEETSEEQFIAAAATTEGDRAGAVVGQECEAFYYAGAKRLATGDTAGARSLFERSVATGVTRFLEHQLAQAELRRAAAPALRGTEATAVPESE